MLGILAHDLRGPIGVISGYVEILEITGEELSENVKKSHAAITDTAAFMSQLIEEVLAVAIAEAGEVKLNCHLADLAVLTRKAIDTATITANKKNIALIADTRPSWIEVDALKIEQVVNNLISNAIKFSSPGSEINLSVRPLKDHCIIRIGDHGTGIPPAIRDNLFKPFCKGQKGTEGERTNGLGFYICSLLVEAHQGRIEVESEPRRGTTFSVKLPIR